MRPLLTASALLFVIDLPAPRFPEGKLRDTSRCLDLAIEGPGFFQVSNNGSMEFTRNGGFDCNLQGELTTRDGAPLAPRITVPADAVEVSISSDGVVSVLLKQANQFQRVGTIRLALFRNPLGMHRTIADRFRPSDESGPPRLHNPGDKGCGRLRQGFLEMLPKVKLDEDE